MFSFNYFLTLLLHLYLSGFPILSHNVTFNLLIILPVLSLPSLSCPSSLHLFYMFSFNYFLTLLLHLYLSGFPILSHNVIFNLFIILPVLSLSPSFERFLLMCFTPFLSPFISILTTKISFSFDLYRSNLSIPLVLSRTISMSLSLSISLSFLSFISTIITL